MGGSRSSPFRPTERLQALSMWSWRRGRRNRVELAVEARCPTQWREGLTLGCRSGGSRCGSSVPQVTQVVPLDNFVGPPDNAALRRWDRGANAGAGAWGHPPRAVFDDLKHQPSALGISLTHPTPPTPSAPTTSSGACTPRAWLPRPAENLDKTSVIGRTGDKRRQFHQDTASLGSLCADVPARPLGNESQDKHYGHPRREAAKSASKAVRQPGCISASYSQCGCMGPDPGPGRRWLDFMSIHCRQRLSDHRQPEPFSHRRHIILQSWNSFTFFSLHVFTPFCNIILLVGLIFCCIFCPY